MFNKVFLMGRLTTDPEAKQTPNGISVCKFSIAVDRGYQKSDGEKITDFINCVAWRTTAEFVSKHFQKGKLIFVEGEINVGKYEDKNGDKKNVFEVTVNKVCFCGDKESRKASETTSVSSSFAQIDVDIPF